VQHKFAIKRIFTLFFTNIVVEGASDCEELVGGYSHGKIVQSITLLRFQI